MEAFEIQKSASKLSHGERGVIRKIGVEQKSRFFELGITEGSEILKIYSAPSGTPAAYEVCGALIALRQKDSEKILCDCVVLQN